jgi:hypothetical protein
MKRKTAQPIPTIAARVKAIEYNTSAPGIVLKKIDRELKDTTAHAEAHIM